MKRSGPPKRRTELRRGDSKLSRSTRLERSGPMRSKSPRPSRIREERRDDDYRAWLRRQPCAIADEIGHARDCRTYGADGCDAAHLGDRGTGIKAPDRTCVPLCRGHHEDQHNVRGSWPRDRGERTTMYKRLIALWNRRYVDDGGRFADRGRAS